MNLRGDLATTPTPPEWIHDALCAQIGTPELWFPAKGGTAEPAKNICRDCPVQPQCLDYGMDQEFGIYGGYSPRERRAMRHGHYSVDCETPLIYPRAKRCRTCANIRRRRQHLEHNLTRERARAALKGAA